MANTVTVIIMGPDFHTSAVELAKGLKIESISELKVLIGITASQLSSLLPAVQYLRNYFHPRGQITLYLADVSYEIIKQLDAASGVSVSIAAVSESQLMNNRFLAERRKEEMERWKILQDTQTKIFEIQQDVTVNKARTQDRAYKKWDEYIRG